MSHLINNFPRDLQNLVFSFLDDESMQSLACTSSKSHRLINEIWQRRIADFQRQYQLASIPDVKTRNYQLYKETLHDRATTLRIRLKQAADPTKMTGKYRKLYIQEDNYFLLDFSRRLFHWNPGTTFLTYVASACSCPKYSNGTLVSYHFISKRVFATHFNGEKSPTQIIDLTPPLHTFTCLEFCEGSVFIATKTAPFLTQLQLDDKLKKTEQPLPQTHHSSVIGLCKDLTATAPSFLASYSNAELSVWEITHQETKALASLTLSSTITHIRMRQQKVAYITSDQPRITRLFHIKGSHLDFTHPDQVLCLELEHSGLGFFTLLQNGAIYRYSSFNPQGKFLISLGSISPKDAILLETGPISKCLILGYNALSQKGAVTCLKVYDRIDNLLIDTYTFDFPLKDMQLHGPNLFCVLWGNISSVPNIFPRNHEGTFLGWNFS